MLWPGYSSGKNNRLFVKPHDQEISAVRLRPGYSAGKNNNRLFVKPHDQEIPAVWLQPDYSAGKKPTGSLLNLTTKRFQLCGYALVTQLGRKKSLFVKPHDQEISAVWLCPGYSAGKKQTGSLLNLTTKRFQLCGYALVTQLGRKKSLFVKPHDQEISAVWLCPGYSAGKKQTGSLLNLTTKRFRWCGYSLITQLEKNSLFVKPHDQEIPAVRLRPGYSAGKKQTGSLLNLTTKRFQLCGYALVTQLEKKQQSLC